MTPSLSNNIAIIGGGSTGPMLLIYMAQAALNNRSNFSGTTFHLVDPNGFGNGGIAYGECSDKHKLNSTRNEMSPWLLDEFDQWCIEKGLGNNHLNFENRATYGEFIAEKLQWAKDFLKESGAHFENHRVKAEQINPNGENFDIKDDQGNIIVSDIPAENINLTLGYGKNDNFENLWQYTGNGYIHSPYDHDNISKISTSKPNPRIAFIGTGPALYDFVNDYDGDPETTTLYAFSREGEFLDTRDVTVEKDEQSITPDFIANEDFIPTNLNELKQAILQDFDQATGSRSHRRVALDIMKNIKPLLNRMSFDLAVEFRKSTLHSYIKGKATPVPLESQQRLESFNPTAVKGRLNGNIERLDDGTFKINVDGQDPIIVDYIVNGSGHCRLNQLLIQNLVAQGLSEIDERFDTLKTSDNDNYKLSNSGINCFGPATHFGIDGVESFAQYIKPYIDNVITRFEPNNDNLAQDTTVKAQLTASNP